MARILVVDADGGLRYARAAASPGAPSGSATAPNTITTRQEGAATSRALPRCSRGSADSARRTPQRQHRGTADTGHATAPGRGRATPLDASPSHRRGDDAAVASRARQRKQPFGGYRNGPHDARDSRPLHTRPWAWRLDKRGLSLRSTPARLPRKRAVSTRIRLRIRPLSSLACGDVWVCSG